MKNYYVAVPFIERQPTNKQISYCAIEANIFGELRFNHRNNEWEFVSDMGTYPQSDFIDTFIWMCPITNDETIRLRDMILEKSNWVQFSESKDHPEMTEDQNMKQDYAIPVLVIEGIFDEVLGESV